jgi:hypothetical protein
MPFQGAAPAQPVMGAQPPMQAQPAWGGHPAMSGPMPFQGGQPGQINLGLLGGQPSEDMMSFMQKYLGAGGSQMRRPGMGAY